MSEPQTIIGIDMGSVSIGIAKLAPNGKIVKTAYALHHGEIRNTFCNIIDEFDLQKGTPVVVTTETPEFVRCDCRIDGRIAVITAARHFHRRIGAILFVGGEKFGIIEFDAKGQYRNLKSNTSCAAGTGSFLDQQAGRLNLTDTRRLSESAFNNTGRLPKIASRCAVFAKTDLIHAQQEGYTLGEISDGLCEGLARNIVDALFERDETHSPVIFCGGVSKNRAVVENIKKLTGHEIVVDRYSHLYGAIGACLNYLEEHAAPVEAVDKAKTRSFLPNQLFIENIKKPIAFHPPLRLELSEYPDFSSLKRYMFHRNAKTGGDVSNPVEVDIYEKMSTESDPDLGLDIYLGIDIGSTSTKAVLMDRDRKTVAGFYTRTAGNPLGAVQHIFQAIDDTAAAHSTSINILGCGTTGSGRKFIGKIIGADRVLDEITAHARAACEIDPDVDTIIEIGGQDSKFTTLRNGMLTSAVMNNVCAAGTGSFIEEQAAKLKCPLSEYSVRAQNRSAPLASDRCTVFMERDLNHYLQEGYTVDDVLASALHSVRENYLLKVAAEANIGERILFLGATAKNESLVAAFEQRLNKPIIVSRFCHLAGALGTALTLSDEGLKKSAFRGIHLYKQDIALGHEVCGLCTNHCKISLAHVNGETVAYGFLCGRDYDTMRYVENKTNDLLRERKRLFRDRSEKKYRHEVVIGIPAAVHLFEDIPFWRKFFDTLGIKTIIETGDDRVVKEGKRLAGAEFCAPVAVMHGLCARLKERADFIFMPYYLENKEKERQVRRQYCYYTQYIPPLMAQLDPEIEIRILTPMIKYLYTGFHTRIELYRMLKSILDRPVGFIDVSMAFDKALDYMKEKRNALEAIYEQEAINEQEAKRTDEVKVVLLGRPYTVLSPVLNSKIPDIFQSLGTRCYYQDMVPVDAADIESIRPLLSEIHWNYAAKILAAAEKIARTDGVYPVLVTAFKCSPDSFVTQYFKSLMDAHEKPYLILELDEHDSSVGYETRIEAAVRAFANHKKGIRMNRPAKVSYAGINPNITKKIKEKTVVVPNWDAMTCKFLSDAMKREGLRAIVMIETRTGIRKSLKFNTGQCIPINTICQGFIDTIEAEGILPEDALLWLPRSEIGCNIRLYPHHIKTILNRYGNEMEKAGVYVGNLSFSEISIRAAVNCYFSYIFGGLLRRIGCKLRPHETVQGETDRVIRESIDIFSEVILGDRSREEAMAEVARRFEQVPVNPTSRPKVAIFGDLYARDNDVMNQDLIRFIEKNGGEVITTPYNHYARMVAAKYFKKWLVEGKYFNAISNKALFAGMTRLENNDNKYFRNLLREPEHRYDARPEKILAEYGIAGESTGESMDNILKIFYIKRMYPDVSLFVQTSPALCCASLVTEAMRKRIERKTGVPVVSITYDGTGGDKNSVIVPYLKYPRKVEDFSDVYKNAG